MNQASFLGNSSAKTQQFYLKKNLIFWHPWDPWERVHIDLNKNNVQTGCVIGGIIDEPHGMSFTFDFTKILLKQLCLKIVMLWHAQNSDLFWIWPAISKFEFEFINIFSFVNPPLRYKSSSSLSCHQSTVTILHIFGKKDSETQNID